MKLSSLGYLNIESMPSPPNISVNVFFKYRYFDLTMTKFDLCENNSIKQKLKTYF